MNDNGTQLTSAEFEDFMKRNNIEQIFTSPGHPATNGQAENYVKTFKKSLIASISSAIRDGKTRDLDIMINRILIDYRNTVHCTTGETPAKLFFGRSLRTRFSNLRPPTVRQVIKNKQVQQKKHFKGKRNVNFNEGQKVMIRSYKNPNSASWCQATVKRKVGPRTYTCVYTNNNREISRHIDQIRDQSVDTDEDVSNVHEHDTEINAVIDISNDSSENDMQSPPGTHNDYQFNEPDIVDMNHENSDSSAGDDILEEEEAIDRNGRKLRPSRRAKAIRFSRTPLEID